MANSGCPRRSVVWLGVAPLACLAVCILPIAVTVVNGQPHPYLMGFGINATSVCPLPQRTHDGRVAVLESGPVVDCQLKTFNVCMELFYYPTVCNSRVVNTTTEGKCTEKGEYLNSTVVSLRAGDSELPATYWVVNFNSTNPMLPKLDKGLECAGYECSITVQTKVKLSSEFEYDDFVTCNTTIFAQAYGWEMLGEGGWDCSEEAATSRCTGIHF